MRKLVFNSLLLKPITRRTHLRSPSFLIPPAPPTLQSLFQRRHHAHFYRWHRDFPSHPKLSSSFSVPLRSVSTSRDANEEHFPDEIRKEEMETEGLLIEEWEEEDNVKPEVGDGGDGGGIVLQNVPWGECVLSIAREVLDDFDEDMELFAFKTSPQGYIYVRLDKISNESLIIDGGLCFVIDYSSGGGCVANAPSGSGCNSKR